MRIERKGVRSRLLWLIAYYERQSEHASDMVDALTSVLKKRLAEQGIETGGDPTITITTDISGRKET